MRSPLALVQRIAFSGLFLLFLASSLGIQDTAEAVDLIIDDGTDMVADGSYDDAWINNELSMNGFDLWIDGTLTINGTGILDGNASASLRVNGTVDLYGDFDLSEGDICYLADGITIRNGGEFIGSEGKNYLAHTVMDATYPNYFYDGSTFTGGSGQYWMGATRVEQCTLGLSSYEMYFVGKHTSSYQNFLINDPACTMNHNNGHVFLNVTASELILSTGSNFEHQFYDLSFIDDQGAPSYIRMKYGAGGYTKFHVYNDLYIDSDLEARVWSTPTSGYTSFIVDGTVTIDGEFDMNIDVNDHSFGDLTIGATGILISTEGTLTVTDTTMALSGTFTHNQGEVVTTSGIDIDDAWVFWDYTSDGYVNVYQSFTVEDTWDNNAGAYMGYVADKGVTLGTASSSGTLSVDYTLFRRRFSTFLYGASADYPATITGSNDVNWDFTIGGAWSIKWLTFTNAATISSATIQSVILEGDVTFQDDVTVGGSYTLDQNDFHLTLGGHFQMDGTHSNPRDITIGSGGSWNLTEYGSFNDLWLDGGILWSDDFDMDIGHVWVNASSELYLNDSAIISFDTLRCPSGISANKVRFNSGILYITSYKDFGSTLGIYIGDSDCIDANGGTLQVNNSAAQYQQVGDSPLNNLIMVDGCYFVDNFYVDKYLILEGAMQTYGGSNGLFVTEGMIVNGTLDIDSNSENHEFGWLDVNAGGEARLSQGTTTITWEDDSGWAVDLDGTISHTGTLVLLSTAINSNCDFIGTGNFNHVEVDAGSTKWYKWVGSTTFNGELTITGGTFQQNANSDSLTVSGETAIDGGTLGASGWSGSFTTSLLNIDQGTYYATSSTTTVTGTTGDVFELAEGGTYTHNDGLLLFEATLWEYCRINIDEPNVEFYDVSLNASVFGYNFYNLGSGTTMFIDNNLTVIDGTVATRSAVDDTELEIYVNGTTTVTDRLKTYYDDDSDFIDHTLGTVVINNGGELNLGGSYSASSGATIYAISVTIDSGGLLEATQGSLTLTGSGIHRQTVFHNNAGVGGYEHNDGTFAIACTDYYYMYMDDAVFYDVDCTASGSGNYAFWWEDFTIENSVDSSNEGFNIYGAAFLGTVSNSCVWDNGVDDVHVYVGHFIGVDASYPVQVTARYLQTTSSSSTIQNVDLTGKLLVGSGDKWLLTGDVSCTSAQANAGGEIRLSGNVLTIDGGVLTTTGTFTTDTDARVNMLNGATHTMNQDVRLSYYYSEAGSLWDCGGYNFTSQTVEIEGGTFYCNSGKVLIGQTNIYGAYPLHNHGSFYGNNSELIIASIINYGTIVFSSETSYCNGRGSGSGILFYNFGSLQHNDGRVVRNSTTYGYILGGGMTFYDFILNTTSSISHYSTGYSFTVENDLTLLNGLFSWAKADDVLTVGGYTSLYNSSILDLSNDNTHILHGVLGTASAGSFIAPSGNLYMRGSFHMNDPGIYVHSNGTIWFDSDTVHLDLSMYCGGSTFYTILFDSDHGDYLHVYEDLYVENMADGTLSYSDGWNYFRFNSNMYLGTVSNRGIARNINLHGAGPHTFEGVSEDYPGKWESDVTFERGTHNIKWIEFENTTTVSSGSYTVTATMQGDCSFSDLIIGSGEVFGVGGYVCTSTSMVTVGSGATFVLNDGHLYCDDIIFEDDWTTDGDLTINGTGTFLYLEVDVGDTLECGNATGDIVCFEMDIEGTYSATPQTTWINYTGTGYQYTCTGVMYHNQGLFTVALASSDKFVANEDGPFWNIYLRNRIYLNSDVWVENEHTGSYFCVYAFDGQTVTLGTDSNSGYSSSLYVWGRNDTITAASEDYPATVSYIRHRHGGAINNMYWLTVNTYDFDHLDSTNGQVYVRGDSTIVNAVSIMDSFDIWLHGGNLTFLDMVDLQAGTSLRLEGQRCTFNGPLTTTGTLTTGGTSEIHLTENASWTPDRNLTLAEFEVDCSIEIDSSNGIRNITFTGPGFRNSTGSINITGSYGDLVYITGAPYWEINSDSIDYFWKYVNVSHGNNTGSSALVALGEGFDLLGPWDFQAPLITPHVISGGLFIDTRYVDSLRLDWTAEDMSFLYSLNVTISDYLGLVIFTQEINETTFGDTAAYRWNLSVPIANLNYGRLLINYTASDAHNPPGSQKARKNADTMLCDLAGELVGKPSGKDKSEKQETTTIKFKKAGPFVSDLFDIEFLTDKKGSQHKVRWTGDNFKMSHWVKLDHGTSVPMRIIADAIEHISSQEFGAAHFLINNDYFYDASDFEATGGKILLLDHGTLDGKEYVTISFTHPDWKKGGGWGLIDPLTGAINSRSVYYNISIGTIPEVVTPNNNSKLPGDSTSTILKVRVYGAGSFEGTIRFYDESGVLLGTQTNVTNNTVALVELGDLDEDILYHWYTVLSVGGDNFTSPTWNFRTGGLEANSAPPGSGRERYGDSSSDLPNLNTVAFFIIFIILIILITKLWIGGEVNKS